MQRANPNVEAHAAWALVAQRKLRRTMVNARWAPAGKGRAEGRSSAYPYCVGSSAHTPPLCYPYTTLYRSPTYPLKYQVGGGAARDSTSPCQHPAAAY